MGLLWIPKHRLTDKLYRYLLRRSGILARVSLADIIVRQVGYPTMRIPNRLFDAGELLAVRTIWRGESVLPASLVGRLYNDTPADADTLATLQGEPTTGGYSHVPWTRDTTDFGAAATVGGVGHSIGVEKDFTAAGAGYGPVTAFVFTTSDDQSGVPFSWFPLGQARTVTPASPLHIQPYGLVRGVSA